MGAGVTRCEVGAGAAVRSGGRRHALRGEGWRHTPTRRTAEVTAAIAPALPRTSPHAVESMIMLPDDLVRIPDSPHDGIDLTGRYLDDWAGITTSSVIASAEHEAPE
ncbi:hypothetical protein ACTI_66510 [Actinoplanes sp. OR16]|nr:hypothetical protein ACTI_66510 [Actinoplanes sp. OR16]